MRNLAVFLLMVTLLGLNSAYWLGNSERALYHEYDEEFDNKPKKSGKALLEELSNSNDLCIPWRAPCPSDSTLAERYNFLRCCSGLNCRCTLWGNNCKCESRLGR